MTNRRSLRTDSLAKFDLSTHIIAYCDHRITEESGVNQERTGEH